ncbi:hypothetical protein GCM10027452_04850 [Micromonospora halotolerans]
MAYEGGVVAGLAAPKPAPGTRSTRSRQGRVVRRPPEARHAAALSRVGGGRKLYDFSNSFDGSPLGGPPIKESVPDPGDRAVLWTADDHLVALTSLLPADSGWILSRHGHHRLRLGHGHRPLSLTFNLCAVYGR